MKKTQKKNRWQNRDCYNRIVLSFPFSLSLLSFSLFFFSVLSQGMYNEAFSFSSLRQSAPLIRLYCSCSTLLMLSTHPLLPCLRFKLPMVSFCMKCTDGEGENNRRKCRRRRRRRRISIPSTGARLPAWIERSTKYKTEGEIKASLCFLFLRESSRIYLNILSEFSHRSAKH